MCGRFAARAASTESNNDLRLLSLLLLCPRSTTHLPRQLPPLKTSGNLPIIQIAEIREILFVVIAQAFCHRYC
jgi:hypothetical protein